MGLARFIIKDPYLPAEIEEEVEGLFCKIHGITHWDICPDGDITYEYDHRMISDEIIEEALTGMGFELEHIFDHPYATDDLS